MMGPEVDLSRKLDTAMEVSPVSVKENGNAMKLPEEKLVVCASNCEDHAFVDTVVIDSEENLMTTRASSYADMHVDSDQVLASKGNNEDVEVDIVENVVPDEEVVVERESLDATENSSSFGCTDSGAGTAGAASDVEVESRVRDDDASLIELDDFFRTRKKKLTAHWRKFIRPLMWRCKWVELQIRELHSQASKYDLELAECSRRKQCELEKCAAEDLGIKSAPSVCQNWSTKVMKRKKRKKVEETTDIAAYSSCHSLFAYFASKRASGDSAYLDDDHVNTEKTSGVGEFGFNGEWSLLESKDSDTFENILRNIEVAQMHVRQLRARIDKVIKENERFTPESKSLTPREPLANCHSSSSLPQASLSTTSHLTSQKSLVLPESVASGYRDVNPLLDVIRTTDQLQIRGKVSKIESEFLLSNQSVKEEFINDTKIVGIPHTSLPMSGTEVKMENVQHVPDPNSPSKMSVTREQVGKRVRPKSIATPNNKRKRGRRKARAGRWGKKASG